MTVTGLELQHLLRACRAAMPDAAGVVLARPDGALVAHEVARVRDPRAIAREGARRRLGGPSTSAMVERDDGMYLVMFL